MTALSASLRPRYEASGLDPTLHQALEEAVKKGYVAAFRLLGSHEESQEACQEAAARVLASKERFDPNRPFYPWFYRILKNHCLDRLKKRKREIASPEIEVPDGERSAESKILSQERASLVSAAMGSLTDDLREIIELRHFQDLSYEVIAEILACPIGTVMSRLYRARKKLREALVQNPSWRES